MEIPALAGFYPVKSYVHQSNALLETNLCCMLIHFFCFFVIFVFTIFTQESHPDVIAPLLFSL